MNQNIENVDYEWLIQPTGDPFTDVGGMVLKFFSEKFPNKNIEELIEEMAKIYVNNWSGKLNAFFLNSTITQPAFKGKRKIEETKKFFKQLITQEKEFKEGYCRITGRETQVFQAGRDNHILSGSSGFINFNHALENGLYVSKEVLMRMFFVPFGLVQLSDKIALIQSNNFDVSEHFVRKNCKENYNLLGTGLADGILKSEFKNPANALFAFIDNCISELSLVKQNKKNPSKITIDDISVSLYHFTNFGATPTVDIYLLESTLFRFYATCNRAKLAKDWQTFIRYHYKNFKFKGAKFNESNQTWETEKASADYEEFKTWRNRIYEKLLANQSILIDIKKWSETKKFNFQIVELYQIYIKNMEKRTLTKIKEIADFIVNEQQNDSVKKAITRLNGSKSSHDVRAFLLGLIKKNYQDDNPKPLITLEEYVEYLFPDSTSWREIRDLMLIAVYQKLHENQISIELELDQNELETQNN